MIRRLLRPWTRRAESELDDEIRTYVDLLTAEKQNSGMPAEQARRAALIEAGGLEQVKEEVRDVRYGAWLETLWRDVRYTARTLSMNPRFTMLAIVSLAIGIGLNSAIFNAINAVILRPLPYEGANRVFAIGRLAENGEVAGLTPANYVEWQRQNRVFEFMAAVWPFHRNQGRYILTADGREPVGIQVMRVSASFFDVLGTPPAMGRGFLPEENQPGSRSVIVSHEVWTRHLQSSPTIIGHDIQLDGATYKVVGVLPKEFRYHLGFWGEVDAWVPDPFDGLPRANTLTGGLRPMARLKPGVTHEQARAELASIARALERLHPRENEGIRLGMAPANEWMVGAGSQTLYLLMGAVVLVLLIACANLANLLLGRAATRQREIAIRTAIGAGRGRLIRQLLTESIVLSISGGVLGLLLAHATASALPHILPEKLFRLADANLDVRVLAFTFFVSVATGILFGLAPALTASRVDVIDALKATAHSASSSRSGSRLRGSLVVVQVALSLILLAGAGLMLNSLWRLYQIELGFRPQNLVFVPTLLAPVPPFAKDIGYKPMAPGNPTLRRFYAPQPAARLYTQRVLENLRRIPGVTSAAAGVFAIPFWGGGRMPFRREDQPSLAPQQQQRQIADVAGVTDGYFETLGIPLLHGRGFDASDHAGMKVAVVSKELAASMWGNTEAAIGKRIRLDKFGLFEIVGVAPYVRRHAQPRIQVQIHVPEWHVWEESYPELLIGTRMQGNFFIRGSAGLEQLRGSIKKAIRDVDPSQPVDEMMTMTEVVGQAFGPWRSYLRLLGLFAAVALLLSAIGVYGVVAYTVAKRTPELGIRIALGADTTSVLRLVMSRGISLALCGVVIGAVASSWLTRYLKTWLYGVEATDPITFSVVAVFLMLVAAFACYLPARRAALMNPASSLRAE
jgi:hypothetical protein